MNMEADDLVVDYPVGATALVAAIATVVYVALQVVLDGAVAVPETVMFVLVFTFIYVSGNYYLRRWQSNGGEEREGGPDDDPGGELDERD